MRGNIKGTMYKIFTMLLVIFIQTTGIYAFNASETTQSSQTEKQSTNMELVVNNTSTNKSVMPGKKIKYTITIANPNEMELTDVKFKINLDADDTTGIITLLGAKDKVGNDILDSNVVSIDESILNIINLPANDIYTIEYTLDAVDPGYNDDTDITNSIELLSNDMNLTLSTESVLNCNITKAIAETSALKWFVESQSDGKIVPGETIYYTIDIGEVHVTAHNLNIRDSLLESLPAYATYNDDFRIEASIYNEDNFVDVDAPITTGDLRNGDFVITDLPANTHVMLYYSVRVNAIPEGVEAKNSVVTTDGRDPVDRETGMPIVCGESVYGEYHCRYTINIHCETQSPTPQTVGKVEEPEWFSVCFPKLVPSIPVTDPMKAKTEIYKSLIESNPDGIADIGETLQYKIEVVNNGTVPAYNTIIRDSMLENLPSYVTFNEDLKITTDIQTTGDLTNGDYTITSIPESSTATITYSITVDELPNNVAKLTNIATKGGSDPDICLGDVEKCSEVILPLKPIEITEENKKEPTSETSVNTEDSIEPKSSIETTLTEQPTVMKKLTTTGGLEVIATLFLAMSGIILITLKKTV